MKLELEKIIELDEENRRKELHNLLSTEEVRENLSFHELEILFNSFNSSETKIAHLQYLLSLKQSEPTSQFANLISSTFLTNIACKDGAIVEYIFTNLDCLNIFLNDKQNFPTYLLMLADEQMTATSKVIYERSHIPLRTQLIESILSHSGARNIRCQLLSYFDKLSPTDTAYYYGMHLKENFCNEHDLIHGEDVLDNFKIICKSKKRASQLITNILLNKFPTDKYPQIPLLELINVVKVHPELSYIIVNTLLILARDAELNEMLKLLVPILKSQVEMNHVESRMSFARLLFAGFDEIESDKEEALSICLSLLEETAGDSLTHSKVCEVLKNFGFAYQQGNYHYKDVKVNLYQCFVILQIVATKTSNDSIKERVTSFLKTPSFIFALGHEFLSEFAYDKAYEIFIRAEAPTFPKLVSGFAREQMLEYATEKLYFAQVLTSLHQLCIEVIGNPESSPIVTFKVAKVALEQNKFDVALTLLMAISVNKLDEASLKQYGELCFNLAHQAIKLAKFSEAVVLFSKVPKESDYFKVAVNYLIFANPEWSESCQSSMSFKDKIEMKLFFLEKSHTELLTTLEDFNCQLAYMEIGFYGKTVQAKKEVEFLINNLQKELRHIDDPTVGKNTANSERKALRSELKVEIEKGKKLNDSKQPPRYTKKDLSVISLYQRGFLQTKKNKDNDNDGDIESSKEESTRQVGR